MPLNEETINTILDKYADSDRLGLGDLLEKRDEVNSRINMYNSYPSYNPDLVEVYKQIKQIMTNRLNEINRLANIENKLSETDRKYKQLTENTE